MLFYVLIIEIIHGAFLKVIMNIIIHVNIDMDMITNTNMGMNIHIHNHAIT